MESILPIFVVDRFRGIDFVEGGEIWLSPWELKVAVNTV